MRFDTPIFFQRLISGKYDATTGDYLPDSAEEFQRWASVTDSGEKTLLLVYGEIRQGCKTIRLLTPYKEPFDRIRIGVKFYKVDSRRTLRKMQVFVVSEVQ